MDTSTLSSLDKDYDDGVYDKAHPPARRDKAKAKRKQKRQRSRSQSPSKKPNRLPALMLVCLVFLFCFSVIGTTASGLYFNRRVAISITSTDCLGQSWIMFSSILGFLYIILHLQSARKGEPINRTQPPSQHPLHSATVVVARLDTIAWVVSLIIAAVVVARGPAFIFYVNLVACASVTPAILIILCVTERAARPFDLPYLTQSPTSSLVTIHFSPLEDNMPEVTTEDSISRRGSYQHPHSNRPNSHTQHAAAVAAANPGNTAAVSGPRPPPSSVKEARPWAFTNFDSRTKSQLAASVNEASHASDMRARVGGPRPLADSEIAIKRGVLAPPMCSDPKVQRLPERKLQKKEEPVRDASSSSGAGGAWTRDWSTLKADTGYSTPANSSVADAVHLPAPRVPLGVPLFSSRIASNRTVGALSPVVEVSEKRSSGGSSGSSGARPATAPPAAAATTAAPAPRTWTTTSTTTRTSTTASHPPPTGPRNQSSSCAAEPPRVSTARYGRTLSYDHTGTLQSPPPAAQAQVATTVPAPTAARTPATRVRLVRAQQAQNSSNSTTTTTTTTTTARRGPYETASLRRPPRLTEVRMTSSHHEVRTPEDDRLFFVNPPSQQQAPPPPRPASNNSGITNLVKCPGSWRESWRESWRGGEGA